MRIILKVSSSNEHCNGGCDFALLDLTPELARLAVGRIATLRKQKSLDPDIEETYYWAYFAEYFSPWKDPASPVGTRQETYKSEHRPRDESEPSSSPQAVLGLSIIAAG